MRGVVVADPPLVAQAGFADGQRMVQGPGYLRDISHARVGR